MTHRSIFALFLSVYQRGFFRNEEPRPGSSPEAMSSHSAPRCASVSHAGWLSCSRMVSIFQNIISIQFTYLTLVNYLASSKPVTGINKQVTRHGQGDTPSKLGISSKPRQIREFRACLEKATGAEKMPHAECDIHAVTQPKLRFSSHTLSPFDIAVRPTL